MAGGKGKSGNWLACSFHQLRLLWDCHVWAVRLCLPEMEEMHQAEVRSSFGVWQHADRCSSVVPLCLIFPHASALSACFWHGVFQGRGVGGSVLPVLCRKLAGDRRATAAALQRLQLRRDTGTYLDKSGLRKSMTFISLNHQASKCKVEVGK